MKINVPRTLFESRKGGRVRHTNQNCVVFFKGGSLLYYTVMKMDHWFSLLIYYFCQKITQCTFFKKNKNKNIQCWWVTTCDM